MKLSIRSVIFMLALVTVATACKFFFGPNLDWSGFSPVIAMALFSGFILRGKDSSFLMPLVALFVSDLIIQLLYTNGLFDYAGFYGGMWKNYLLILSATLVGWIFNGRKLASLVAGGFIAPTLYFLASNFMVWASTSETIYARSFAGLMTCYEAGIPFYRNSLLAMIVFLPILLVSYNYYRGRKLNFSLA